MENCKEKIKKLLALSESSNEHEAKAALLKAKQLMMEHKITESDLVDKKELGVKKVESTITYSSRRDPWIDRLTGVLAENYLCRFVESRNWGRQTKNVQFWGLEEDVEICLKVFEYAVDCIRSQCKRIRKENFDYSAQSRSILCNGYAMGFILGLKEAFEEQAESIKSEWGLVPTMSEEVVHSTDDLKEVRANNIKASGIYKLSGYADGKNFDMRNRVAAN